MKRAVASLVIAVLVLAQGLFTGSGETARKTCPQCACGKDCCVQPGSATPLQAPVAPAQPISFKPGKIALALSWLSPNTPVFSVTAIFSPSFSSSGLQAVPLYQRNCAILI